MSNDRTFQIAGFILAVFGGAGLVAACTPEPGMQSASGTRGRECFSVTAVNGFRPIDRDTVDVTVGSNRTFRLELVGTCTDINWTQRIAIRSRSGGSFVCAGLDADLVVPDITGTQVCPVTDVRLLSPEEAEASRRSG